MSTILCNPISLVLAQSANGIIGNDGSLPWNIPEDMAFFRRVTMMNRYMLMGRVTFEGFPGPLAKRICLVLTRKGRKISTRSKTTDDSVLFFPKLGDIPDRVSHKEEIVVIGGVRLFCDFLEHAGQIFITCVDRFVQGNVSFDLFSYKSFRPFYTACFPKNGKLLQEDVPLPTKGSKDILPLSSSASTSSLPTQTWTLIGKRKITEDVCAFCFCNANEYKKLKQEIEQRHKIKQDSSTHSASAQDSATHSPPSRQPTLHQKLLSLDFELLQ